MIYAFGKIVNRNFISRNTLGFIINKILTNNNYIMKRVANVSSLIDKLKFYTIE